MQSYKICLEQTQKYAEAFNARNLKDISDLLDDAVMSSSQRTEGVKVGKKAVLDRVTKLWGLAKKKKIELTASLGIIDLEGSPAHPCLLVYVGQKPRAAVVFEVGKKDKIYLISALTNRFMVNRVRLTNQEFRCA
jgi:hypothetical protein